MAMASLAQFALAMASPPAPHRLLAPHSSLLPSPPFPASSSSSSNPPHLQPLSACCTGSIPCPTSPASPAFAPLTSQKRPFLSAFDSPEEILEDETVDECVASPPGKRGRRLTVQQVRALEKAFDVDNKLEPETKMKLANELGLQGRQISVWFQNRRARWKTKQMEKDYYSLKKQLESLKADRDEVLKVKERLQAEVIKFRGDINIKETAKEMQIPRSASQGELERESLSCSPDQKEKEKELFRDPSSDSAIDDVDNLTRTASSIDLIFATTVIHPGDMAMQAQTTGLDFVDSYYGRTVYCPRAIKGEEIAHEDVESGCVLVPFDWWETG